MSIQTEGLWKRVTRPMRTGMDWENVRNKEEELAVWQLGSTMVAKKWSMNDEAVGKQ